MAFTDIFASFNPSFFQQGIFAEKLLGITLGNYALCFLTILLFLILGKIAVFIFGRYVRKLAAKTKSKFDDIIAETLSKPMLWLFVLAGFYFGIRFLSSQASILALADTIVSSLAILLIAWLFWRFVDSAIKFYFIPIAKKTATQLDEQLISFARNVAKAAIGIIAISMLLEKFGYDITALVASLSIGSLALAFAAKETITDIFGGINLLASQPFVVGDKVKIGSSVGKVKEIGLMHIRLVTDEGYLITIPNRKVASSEITNMSAAKRKKQK